MGFIEDVQAYLKAQAEPPAPLPALPPGFDMEKRRAVMWEALEQAPPRGRKRAYDHWTQPGYLERFVAHVAAGMSAGVAARWPAKRLTKTIDALLLSQIRGGVLAASEVGGEIVLLELQSQADMAEAAFSIHASFATISSQHYSWMQGLRLIDGTNAPTRSGRVLLGLAGREAVHYLLELEAALSTGPGDPLRLSPGMLRELMKGPHALYGGLPFSRESAQHMQDFGIAHNVYDGDENFLSFTVDAAELVRTVLDPAPNPYRALVQTLLDAERGKLTTAITGVPATGGSDLAYVRMVVHELRNLSFPLATALRGLWTELERPSPDPARISDLRDRLDRSVAGITEFSNVSARLALAVTEEAFSLRESVDEAVESTIPERNGRIRVDTSGLVEASIDGARARWTLLFVNLLRNAAQCRAGSGTVWIRSEWSAAGTLRLYVDDDGPGIPEELRDEIFEMGVSLRGGSGLGLHEARTTVLLSGGSMRCEASPQGGARFAIRVAARSPR